MSERPWLIYGAYGYTGRRIAREAVGRGARPILAGRDERPLRSLADELGCPARVFSLDDADTAAAQLDGVGLVLNCAGPFSRTAPGCIEACVLAGVHYLDITGEIDVIELAASLHSRAAQAGICVIPAVGFDVVPSDCLAGRLHQLLPHAVRLQLAFWSSDTVSPGTARTAWESAAAGARARVDGRIRRVPAGKRLRVPFRDRPRDALLVPWGDVASAYYTTGIPNIEVYAALPRPLLWLRPLHWIAPLAGLRPLRQIVAWLIGRSVRGPADDVQGRSEFWGCVTDAQGRCAEATLSTIGAYALTVQTALTAAERVRRGDVAPGFHTPARAFGVHFVEEAVAAKIEATA